MMVFRFAALAWVAAASLCLFSLSSRAQEAEAEVKLVEHTYDLSGLTRSEFMRTPRNGGIGDVLAPDHLFSPQTGYEARPDYWSLRASGDEARCWDDSSEVLGSVANFCNPEG